jgi:dephospho-CoA kinase
VSAVVPPAGTPPAGTPPGDDGRRALRIGLTGPIGCGKSQIARWLAELGVHVVDADQVAREVTAPGTVVHDAILRHFGDAVRGADGNLDRAALGRIVFGDPAALAVLERLVHPATRPAILMAIEAGERAGAPAVAVEAIKLVEGGLAGLCDEVWLVTCSPVVQRERILSRGTPPEVADQRIAAQAGLADRLRSRADVVLDTSGSLEETRLAVVTALGEAIAAHR